MDGGMEEAMEAAAAMDGDMEAMDGEPGDAMEAEASPEPAAQAEAAPVAVKVSHANDERFKAMIKWIGECLENFKESEHWTEDHNN